MENLKNSIRKIILTNRLDLEKQLLFYDSEIFNQMFEKANEMNVNLNCDENIQKVWTTLNLEDPIQHQTAELDLVFDENFREIKTKLINDGIYNETLIQISESEECQKVYQDHNYFDIHSFSYTHEFEEQIKNLVTNYITKYLLN